MEINCTKLLLSSFKVFKISKLLFLNSVHQEIIFVLVPPGLMDFYKKERWKRFYDSVIAVI